MKTSKSEFNQYWNFVRKSSENYDESLKQLPKRVQDIVKKDMGILPHHLSTDHFYEMFVAELKKLVPDFKIDSASQPILKSISQYFSQDAEFIKDESFSFNKGILLMGGVGTGKTMLFKGLIETLNHFRYKDPHSWDVYAYNFFYVPSYAFAEGFSKKGFPIFDEGLPVNGSTVHVTTPRLIIDDLGVENICSHFGSTTNIIAEVIFRRYDNKVVKYAKSRHDNKAITFGTTNLDRKCLKAFYGDRAYSRMVEMMNFLIYEGNDRRH